MEHDPTTVAKWTSGRVPDDQPFGDRLNRFCGSRFDGFLDPDQFYTVLQASGVRLFHGSVLNPTDGIAQIQSDSA